MEAKYVVMNLFEGKFRVQGLYRYKAEALRDAAKSQERTTAYNRELGRNEAATIYIVVNRETGEIVGGKANPNELEI